MGLIGEFTRLQTDVALARQEMILGFAAKPLLRKAQLPDGQGRPVMLLPGFGANEALLRRLETFLRECGYVVEIFVPGFPADESLREFIDRVGVTMSERIADLKTRTGAAVSLVGQSAGGLYSREFAAAGPDDVDRVITLGSPTFCPENLHLQNKALALLIERRFGTSSDRAFADDRFMHWDRLNPEIPYVAIYSPIDGAVRPETAVIPEAQLNVSNHGAIRENVAILASHFGMVQNPLVILAVADRLGADKTDWQVFDARQYLPESLERVSSFAFPPVDLDKYEIPVADLHPRQPRGRDARERVINTLRTEHRNIGKLLDTVLEEVGDGHGAADDVPNYAVIAGIVDYLENYTDGFHHPREDLMFARLIERKPELRDVTDKLIGEHAQIEAAARDLESHLARHLDSPRAHLRNKTLDARCRRYVKTLRAHLQLEEDEVFPHADVLGTRDWAAVDKGLAHEPDPLFGSKVQERYEELADALAGRVEGISESATLTDVLSLGAAASSLQTLGSGLAEIRDQQIEQAKAAGETQKRVFRDAVDSGSVWALATLPFTLTKANVELAKKNTASSYASVKHVARDVVDSWRRARDAS